jgi:pyruvate formate lyase activating enzyme
VSWAQLEGLLPLTDLVMLDIKHMDPDKHREATGSDNRLILANAERLAAQAQALAVRIPVVPGFNDTPREIGEIRRFVESLKWLRKGGGPLTLSLLPFHPLAGEKYASLGLPNRVAGLVPPTAQRMRELGEAARLLPDTEEAWQLQLSIPA